MELKCVSKNKKPDIFVDNNMVYQMDVPEPAVKIKGIIVHFEGAGSVKNVSLGKNDEFIYSTGF